MGKAKIRRVTRLERSGCSSVGLGFISGFECAGKFRTFFFSMGGDCLGIEGQDGRGI